ncbi:hypothetical protein GQ457_02G039280 [Hibiscus cannabinus]
MSGEFEDKVFLKIVNGSRNIRGRKPVFAIRLGVFSGLLLVWDKGIHSVIIEVDNLDVFNALSKSEERVFSCPLVLHILTLIRHQWEVRFSHVLRREVLHTLHYRHLLFCMLYMEMFNRDSEDSDSSS